MQRKTALTFYKESSKLKDVLNDAEKVVLIGIRFTLGFVAYPLLSQGGGFKRNDIMQQQNTITWPYSKNSFSDIVSDTILELTNIVLTHKPFPDITDAPNAQHQT